MFFKYCVTEKSSGKTIVKPTLSTFDDIDDTVFSFVKTMVLAKTSYKTFERDHVHEISWGQLIVTDLLDFSVFDLMKNQDGLTHNEMISIVIKPPPSAGASSVTLKNAFCMLMAPDSSRIRYVEHKKILFPFLHQKDLPLSDYDDDIVDEITTSTLQKQVKMLLASLLCEVGLGYIHVHDKSILQIYDGMSKRFSLGHECPFSSVVD